MLDHFEVHLNFYLLWASVSFVYLPGRRCVLCVPRLISLTRLFLYSSCRRFFCSLLWFYYLKFASMMNNSGNETEIEEKLLRVRARKRGRVSESVLSRTILTRQNCKAIKMCLFVLYISWSSKPVAIGRLHLSSKKLNDNFQCYLFSLNFNTCAAAAMSYCICSALLGDCLFFYSKFHSISHLKICRRDHHALPIKKWRELDSIGAGRECNHAA